MSKTSPIGLVFFFIFLIQFSSAQEPVKIHIVSDINHEKSDVYWFEETVMQEVLTLNQNRRKVEFELTFCDYNPLLIASTFEQVFNDSETDIVLGVGVLSSAILSARKTYPKPAISGIIINPELQNVPLTDYGTSGVSNYSYVRSPFQLDRDLEALYRLVPYKKLGVIGSAHMVNFLQNFDELFSQNQNREKTEVFSIPIAETIEETLQNIPDKIEAIYVLPVFDELTSEETTAFFDGLSTKKLPSVALLGEDFVSAGALMGFEAQSNLARMPRRVAINVTKIIEGMNASELPVIVETYSENLIINMATARKIEIYPDWDMAASAILLNVNNLDTKRSLNLKGAIYEALENNLEIKAAKKNPIISQKDIDLAKADLLPQLDANTSLVLLDEGTTNSSFGTRGRLNWGVGLDASQLIFAEPALANIAIQKLLKESEKQGLSLTQMDVVLDAASAYLNILQAKSLIEVQSENVKVTKNNLDIAKAKEAVGYSGVTDLYRWESELALDKIDLNDAYARVRQAQYALNQFLNRPINETFQTEDVLLSDQVLTVTDSRIRDLIHNEGELQILANFLVQEAMNNLPELKQFDIGIAAQDRLLLSQKRANYLPSVALSGGWDYNIQRWKTSEIGDVLEMIGLAPENKPTWNMALGFQYPIFQGMTRQHQVEQTKVGILQLQDQKANLKNQLELRVRSSLETAGASFFRWERSQEAAEAAKKNFQVIQDSYSHGLVNITTLIDAQNASVQTELNAVNATYQFIIDFLTLERAGGFYYLLATQAEKDAFFTRLAEFISK